KPRPRCSSAQRRSSITCGTCTGSSASTRELSSPRQWSGCAESIARAERGTFVLPLVPHSTEDRTCVETDAVPDEEGDQCDDNAGGTIALLPRSDLVREEERGDDSETREAGSGCQTGGEHSPQRDLAVQEHVRRPPPEGHREHEREQEDEAPAAYGA